MTVRRADETATFVDSTVAEGRFSSRADYLGWLVRRDAMDRRARAALDTRRASSGEGDPSPGRAGDARFALDLDRCARFTRFWPSAGRLVLTRPAATRFLRRAMLQADKDALVLFGRQEAVGLLSR